MVSYKVQVTFDAKEDLKRYRDYLRLEKRSPIAAKSIVTDFKNTVSQLKLVADSLQIPESEELQKRRLKRINFFKHDYFLLYRIDGDVVTITNMFHSLEDYENKLR